MTAVTSAGRLALACSSAIALMYSGGAAAVCMGSGAPTSGFLECFTAISIPTSATDPTPIPIRSFDISWVDASRGLYFLGNRSSAGIDIIDTNTNKWIGRATGFVGIQPPATLPATVAVNNNISGPDGVISHGRWLYGGDGDSTLKVFDVATPAGMHMAVQTVPTGGTTRLDEMGITTNGKMLLGANNAEDPPFATLFMVNGDNPPPSAVSIIGRVTVDPQFIPAGDGLSIENPVWDPRIGRFLVSVPTIKGNPYDSPTCSDAPPVTCSGAMLIVDPSKVTAAGLVLKTLGTDIIPLNNCAPNGSTVGPRHNAMLGCTPGNQPSNNGLTIISDLAPYPQLSTQNVSGADEVWYDSGTNKYLSGSSKNPLTLPAMGQACIKAQVVPAGKNANVCPVLGVVDGKSNFTVQKIPQSQNSHSVAADSKRHFIYDPQVGAVSVVGVGGDNPTTAGETVGAGICGSNNGCIGVYRPRHHGDKDDDDDHEGHDD